MPRPSHDPGPDPGRVARLELLRAVGGLALAPLRLAGYGLEADAIRAAVRADLATDPPAPAAPAPRVPTERPLRLFVSCGEASSAVHAARLVTETDALLRRAGAPPARWIGLGGADLRAVGVEVLADPTTRATIAGQGVLGEVGFWRGVLAAAAGGLRAARCDALAAVDAPALHVPLARVARRYGLPTLHYVTPQYWAWAPWRVHGYRRVMTRALCILPFEPAWFARHGVEAAYVGHPQVDLLAEVPTPPPPDDPRRDAVALLPGSRVSEIEHVLPLMLRAARNEPRLRAAPQLVLQRTDEHLAQVRAILAADGGRARVAVGDLHVHLARSRAALATSGTVLIDLTHHRLPAVVLYALRGSLRRRLTRWLGTVPHFASPNLLAGAEVLPELYFCAERPPGAQVVGSLLERCYNDDAWRQECARGLERAAQRLGPPGAAGRAAAHLVDVAAATPR